MALGSNQVTVGTDPTLLASVPAGTVPGTLAHVLLFADATVDVFLGGGNVSTTNGLTLTKGQTAPVTVPLGQGEELFGVVATGTATVGVLQT